TLAEVLKMEPEWGALPANIPPRIRDLLQRCLRKDPRQRLQAIGDARIAIEDILSGAAAQYEAGGTGRMTPPLQKRLVPWAIAAAAIIVAVIFATGYFLRAPQPARAVVSQIVAPEGAEFALWGVTPGMPALSPDGRQLAFGAKTADGRQLLFVRPLDSATARPMERTDGVRNPFWSTDGRSVGYFAKNKLYRIDVSGGPPIELMPNPSQATGAWNRDGTILLGGGLANGTAILRVPASGGNPEQIGKFTSFRQIGWPQFLPDERHFLFYAVSVSGENDGTYAGSLDGGNPVLVMPGESHAVYAPSGYLLFVRDGTLMAQPFNASKLSLSGDAMPLAENVAFNVVIRRGIFAVSQNGTLVYETATSGAKKILWYDRSGKQIAETGAPSDLGSQSISPDGTKLAVSDSSGGKPDIWVYDLARGIKTRITHAPGINADPFWPPDGKSVCFLSNRGGPFRIYEKAADGTGEAKPMVAEDAGTAEFFGSWSGDGRYLVFQRSVGLRQESENGPASGEIWGVALSGDRKPFPVVQNGQFVAIRPALSPDAKWLAYVS
ncbi:MAG TPA: hypothetical protein VE263_09645, partial [Candidatus Angelobacter sp.]|nr:hypothetical protein [Candidatus Angelobacter sp.]